MSPETPPWSAQPYRLGCPIWSCPGWKGNLYRPKTVSGDELPQYARVFGCVEGNSTFYALPSLEVVDRWCASTPAGFHFCFKFPQEITHRRMLVGAEETTAAFFERMIRLPDRLGPLLLQLPPSFGPNRLDDLARFLRALPDDFEYAVEVRHLDFFDAAENDLTDVLDAAGVAWGLMDTRAVHAAKATDATTITTQSRKPKVPWRKSVCNGQPFVRIVGQNDVSATTGYLDQWAETTAGWLAQGWSPYIFVHAPDDYYAPRLARAFHYLLRKRSSELPDHPPWPGETADTQLSLL